MLVDTGKVAVGDMIGGNAAPEALSFCLYTNTPTWDHATTIGDLTEAAWAGYARGTVGVSLWNVPTLNAGFQAVKMAAVMAVFNNGSGSSQTANGFFVIGFTTGTLYGGDEFVTPLVIPDSSEADFVPLLITDTI